MRGNPIKEKLGRGETVFGTMIFEFLSPGLPQILETCGAEFVMYDMEHSGFGIDSIRPQIALCRGLRIVPFVRVPTLSYHFVSSALDCGALGIMMPMVGTGAEAEQLVSWTRYPPSGVRGAAFGLAHDDYEGGDVAEKMTAENQRTLVIAQIETEEGVENVEEIVSVPGVDVAWLGHFDLSVSLGIPAQFDHPRFVAAVKRIVEACRKYDKTAGVLANDVAVGRAWMAEGFRALMYSRDSHLLATSLREGLSALRQG